MVTENDMRKIVLHSNYLIERWHDSGLTLSSYLDEDINHVLWYIQEMNL